MTTVQFLNLLNTLHEKSSVNHNDFSYSIDMKNCIQDTVFHAEGDVWTHTQMVINQVYERCISVDQFFTALYHDVAKPATRTEEFLDNRIKVGHPNHSRLGAQICWFDLWKSEKFTLEDRLEIYWRIKWHQKVFHMWTQPDMIRAGLTFSKVGNWKKLIEFARCDNLGRICPNIQTGLDSLDLLEDWLNEEQLEDLLIHDATRVAYFENSNRSHLYDAMETTGSNVIILCGLPGSGKDTYIQNNLRGMPIISLDSIRELLKIRQNDNQGSVIQYAKEKAKEYLRDKTPFIWNATNITYNNRQKTIRLFRDYDAHIKIIAFDIKPSIMFRQNKDRINMVPVDAIIKMANKFEPPTLLECHQLEWVKSD